MGTVEVGYFPCDATGEGDPPEDLLEVEEPKEMLGREIFFNVKVNQAKNLPMDLCTNVFVEYLFKHEPENVYRTEVFNGKNPSPVFNYSKLHSVDCINDYILEYFLNDHIVFKTYGNPAFGGQIAQNKQMVTPAKQASAPALAQAAPGNNAAASAGPSSGGAGAGSGGAGAGSSGGAHAVGSAPPGDAGTAGAAGAAGAAGTTTDAGGKTVVADAVVVQGK